MAFILPSETANVCVKYAHPFFFVGVGVVSIQTIYRSGKNTKLRDLEKPGFEAVPTH